MCSEHDVFSYAYKVKDPCMLGATVVFVMALALSTFTMVFTARKQGRTLEAKHKGIIVSFCSCALTGIAIILVTDSDVGKYISADKAMWWGQYFMWSGCASMLACAVSAMFFYPPAADAVLPQFHAFNSPVKAPAQV